MSDAEKSKTQHAGLLQQWKIYSVDEFKRAPIATTAILVGAIGSVLMFIFAGTQPHSESKITSPILNGSANGVGVIEVKNILMVISFFLFSSFLGAGIVRLIAKKYENASIVLSILIASFTNFLTIFFVFLAPPRAVSEQLFHAAHNNVFYTSMLVYLTVCGSAVFKDIGRTMLSEPEDKSSGGGMAFLLVAGLLIAIWGWAVFAAQKRLTETFLPDIAHYIEQAPIKK
ncbi:hypothetical protein C9382_11760 [Pseudomonas aylmerensis]|uniref:Uncharacterized protein n=1 Tax=Pseudomonas aylmerensis TaxID=1869229 RepID=A0A2T4G1T4_9PSED|nr:hypothetical protein [Pseudomonas aylmerensis]OCW20930.1 hypothetical protein BBG20_25165 [Pseudomonas aylmerensis]PTC29587.1 hypothetical protein C9382_11760 [Pseudomonas aylmerensis]